MTQILVVDDELDILEMTRIMLESSGFEVITASDGEKALEIVEEKTIDLILLDAVMPGIHGLDVCRALKRNPKTKIIPIIIFSALGTGVDMMLDDQDKADAYLSKPFTRKILLDKVQVHLEKRS
ncbi:response regulator [Candidatus Bathyarchaeota archaeon]|nr:response regulator [Candidatus Bathyarchaeota archaeon]MBT4319906.1 response regulator [Candidatus Bathyarchaeota archaeon]MBT4422828.1 response regulator [Candidatus Bathyarchaeota archaeon]MBT5642088.1 response regulator [Candidatus Bathyarchaeota archaeon]MBT6605569.1 response regulator [Candidatus Bathyarchaeota archaeon]